MGKVLTYGYDAGSNRNLLKLSGVNYASYGYDDANRLTNLTNSADNAVINFGYDNANKLTQRNYPNGVATTYDYDGMSRLTRLKDAGATVNFDRQYSYNTANQINQIIEPTMTRSFGYDNLDRLISVSPSTGTPESYSFDAVGNRTASHLSASYGYQPFNRLTSAVGKTFSYDNNGNMTTRNDASGAWKYSWDYENRLKQASVRGGIGITYKYDALGRRIERVPSTGVSTQFTYDGQDVLLDQNSDGTTVKYLNGAGLDNKLRQTTGSTAQYFLSDHLGSTNALVNSSGAITSQTAYDGFGNQTATIATRYGYTGRERDDSTGLMYYRARQYSPDIGRFISEDPIGFKGKDINLYAYVKNQPCNLRDPLGLAPNPYWGGCVALFGFAGSAGGFALGGGVGALAGGVAIPLLGYEGALWGGAFGATVGVAACGTPPFPNIGDLPYGTPPFPNQREKSCDAKPRPIPRTEEPRPERPEEPVGRCTKFYESDFFCLYVCPNGMVVRLARIDFGIGPDKKCPKAISFGE